jgi:hypothetical protein
MQEGCGCELQIHLLKYIQAVSANNTMVTTQRDEPFIPVFLAMEAILNSQAHPL